MMAGDKRRFLYAVGGVAAVSIVLALTHQSQLSDRSYRRAPAFNLYADELINRAEAILIETSEASYTLDRREDGWRLREKADFPVAQVSMQGFLDTLQDLRPAALSTARPENFAAIGLTDPNEDGFGAVVEIEGADTSYIFGMRGAYQYARERGSDQSWRLTDVLPPLHNPLRWISLGEDSLPRIHDNPTFLEAEIGGVSTVYQDMSDPAVEAAIYTAQFLSLEDVRRASLAQPYAQISFHYDTGMIQTIELIREGSEVWARFSFAPERAEFTNYQGREFRLNRLEVPDLLPEG